MGVGTLRALILAALTLGASSAVQAQNAEPTSSIREEVLSMYRTTDYRLLMRRETGEDPGVPLPTEELPPGIDGTVLDILNNNNTGGGATGGFTQSETAIVAFGNTVVSGFNDSGSNAGGANRFTGWARSTDGGATFLDGGSLPASAGGDAGDPVLARNDATGRIYFSTLGFSVSTIQVFRSDDGGATWMAPVNGSPGGSSEDKQWHTVDNFAGPGNGNVYLISRRFGTNPGIYVFRSTDHGNTFGPNLGVNIVSGAQGAYIAVGPDHAVYAFWWGGANILMRKSTDFGVTFGAPITVATGLVGGTNGDLALTGLRQGTASFSGFRSNSFPHAAVNPVSGHIYVTFNDNPAGTDKADVYLVMSTDGGATWSARTRVNDDATTTDQWQPTIAVTPDGVNLGVFYSSREEDPATNNLFKYWGRTALISGAVLTWSPSAPISDTPSLPEFGRDAVVNSVYMGDYNSAAATPGFFHLVWSDNRSDYPAGPPRKDPNVYYKKINAGLLVGPNIAVSPANVAFGPTAVTSTANRVVNLLNIGDAPLTVTSISSPSPEFALVSPPATPFVLPSLGSQVLNLTFAPTSLGAQASSMTINSDALNTPSVNVPITGEGVQNITVGPLAIDFGTVPVGTSVGPTNVTVTNTGAVSLTINSITTPAPDFSISHGAVPAVLGPGGTFVIGASFAPLAPGVQNGSFTINSNAIGAPSIPVSLTGNGIVAPSNDLCTNAIPLQCGQSINGTTVLSTFDNVGTCGTSNTTGGVWYTVTGTGAPITVSTCAGGSYDTKISVFSGTCAAKVCVGGNDDSCGLLSSVTFNSVAGTTYFVLVHGFSAQTGTFTLTVSPCPAIIGVTPASLTVDVPWGGTGSTNLNIANNGQPGAANLTWSSLTRAAGALPEIQAQNEENGFLPGATFQVTDATMAAIGSLPAPMRNTIRNLALGQPAMEKEAFVEFLNSILGAENVATYFTVIMEASIIYPGQEKEEPGLEAAAVSSIEPELNGAGGPDAFGYEWKDSDAPGGPVFGWIDITGTGTAVSLTDDSSVNVALPFTFSFYGQNKTSVYISSNGFLTFNVTGSTTFSNAVIPTAATPNDFIAAFWDDLNPALGGTVHYRSSPTQFIVQYTNILRFGTTSGPNTFQIILNSDGSIVYQYLSMNAALLTSATIGIENSTGTVGLQQVFNAAYVHNNLAVRIATAPPCTWITSLTPSSGSIAQGANQNVAVAVSAGTLAVGSYNCLIRINSNAFNTPSVTVPITMNVLNVAPQWTTEPGAGDQTVQYSDAIVAVDLDATDDGATGNTSLTASTSYTVDGGPAIVGLPSGLSLTANGCTGGGGSAVACSWTLSGQNLQPAGVYAISVVASDGDQSSDPYVVTITVNAEDANVAFAGSNPVSLEVDAPGGDSPSFVLSFDVTEFDNPNNVVGDANMAGDINAANVTVTLVPVGPGANQAPISVASVITPGLADPDSPYDYDLRSIAAQFDNVPVNTYAVVVTINGGYYTGGNEDVLTVYDPSLGFTTGGGFFYWPGTEDTDTGYPGDKTNFGFSGKYQNNGTPQGNLLVVRHLADGSSARFKSSSVGALSIGSSGGFGWATMSGTGSYTAIGADTPAPNHDFLLYAEDHGEPGSSDRFWLRVSNGGVPQADLSLAGPAAANAETIDGGDIQIPHAANQQIPDIARSGETTEIPVSFALSTGKPNPFKGETTLQYAMPVAAHASLVVFDVAGREVARLVDGDMPAGRHAVSWSARGIPGGVYFARFTAGSFTQTRRMLLLQ